MPTKQRELPTMKRLLGVQDAAVEEPTIGDATAALRATDLPDWVEEHFYVPAGGRAVMPLHQKAISRVLFNRRDDGRFPYQTILYSVVKKSGKSTWGGMVARWFAETQSSYGEIYCVGNDLKQARERAFREARRSIEKTPGYVAGRDVLPGRWAVLMNSLRCLTTGSVISALAVDARGEAGGAPALSVWTELWGFEYDAAIRFWDELTTVPTIPDSIRLVETYAGFEGESMLLHGLYRRGLDGRQLTNGEVARIAARDRDGERYEDFLGAWTNDTWGDTAAADDPDALVPIWIDDRGLAMYWDSGLGARRMPWQRGDAGRRYYMEQEVSNRPPVFRQHHLNEWASSESNFVPIALWDACQEDLPALMPGDKTPIVVAVDAASTGDCFAIVAVSRHPDPTRARTDPAIRAIKVWYPPKGGRIDYAEPEGFLRWLVQGGCPAGHPQYQPWRRRSDDVAAIEPREDGYVPAACAACDAVAAGTIETVAGYNVVQICYDPYQMEDMMQRFDRESRLSKRANPNAVRVWCEEFSQKEARAHADRRFYDLIVNRRLAHMGDEELRRHIRNANAKTQKDEDSKLRIVKKAEGGGKIDLAVAASMGCDRVLELVLA